MQASGTATGPPRRLLWFTGPVIAAGTAIIAHAMWQFPSTPYPIASLALGGLALVAATFVIKIPGVAAWVSISDTFFFTSVLLFGPAPATLSIALDSLVMSWRRGHRLHQLLFNPTSSAVALWSGAQLYYTLQGPVPFAQTGGQSGATTFLPLAAMAAMHFVLNSGLTVVAVGLDKRISPLRLWRDNFVVIALNYLAAASASFFLVILMHYAGMAALAAVLPLICICYVAMRSWLGRVDDAQRHVQKLNDLYMSTIGAFSTAIEAKDGVTSDHVHRVQAYARGLARALGVTDQSTLQAIEAASLLHDTGKLAVPEHILNKPGRLTAAEFETMKMHVDVGADILSSIDFPYPVVPIVRAHHENWDGTGYPRKLRGEEIPIGARILAVVDCFDALTSDRPYRPAMSELEAIDIIIDRRGTMYDPHVVDTFLSVYRDIAPAAQQQPALQSALRRIRNIHQPAQQNAHAASRVIEGTLSADASEELLAFVSLARIVSHTPTVRDIGLMAWGHLRHLAPGASMALYTIDSSRGALVAQCTAGPGAERLSGITINVAHRVSGWVAANWQSIFNADADLELDSPGELRFATSIPLVAGARLVAVMTLYAPDPFSELQTRRLEIIAPHLAASLGAAGNERVRTAPPELRVVARR